jgi:hypothetical protein
MTKKDYESIEKMRDALNSTLPLLIRLGDFIGNDFEGVENGRCDVILKVRAALGLERQCT